MSDSLITFVLPCYNERELAVENTKKVLEFLRANHRNFELLICDDASNDGTSAMLDALKEPELRVLHFSNGPSRRENLALALREGKGEILVYMDMDLSTSLEDLERLIQAVRDDGFDISIGSRYEKGASVSRELLRLLYSICYNRTIRLLFGSRIRDHQCGFKAFRRGAFLPLCDEMGYDSNFARGWFWDAELLVRAQRKNLRIRELPVRWIRAEKSSFHFARELKVIPYMLRLRFRL